jgi:hypothetical protein
MTRMFFTTNHTNQNEWGNSMYKPIEIDRQNLTIMDIRFSDLDTLNRACINYTRLLTLYEKSVILYEVV